MTASVSSPPSIKPPWNWTDRDREQKKILWKQLSDWVNWLEHAYDTWVQLPPCWALHEGLCTELRIFWYWHKLVMKAQSDPAQAVRWHRELRTSAHAWSLLANCAHEPQLRQLDAMAEQRAQQVASFTHAAIDADVRED
jgi:hypothetical protein